MKCNSLRIDMTPMVDLGFLLITFFVMTVQLNKPSSIDLIMPHDGTRTKLQESVALTVLLGNDDQIWYYHGDLAEAIAQNEIHQTSFSYNDGLGKVIREKQLMLDKTPTVHNGREGLTILIKATTKANYERIVDVLDEMIINNIKRYALVKFRDGRKNLFK